MESCYVKSGNSGFISSLGLGNRHEEERSKCKAEGSKVFSRDDRIAIRETIFSEKVYLSRDGG